MSCGTDEEGVGSVDTVLVPFCALHHSRALSSAYDQPAPLCMQQHPSERYPPTQYT
jgi:hypothetical protein